MLKKAQKNFLFLTLFYTLNMFILIFLLICTIISPIYKSHLYKIITFHMSEELCIYSLEVTIESNEEKLAVCTNLSNLSRQFNFVVITT